MLFDDFSFGGGDFSLGGGGSDPSAFPIDSSSFNLGGGFSDPNSFGIDPSQFSLESSGGLAPGSLNLGGQGGWQQLFASLFGGGGGGQQPGQPGTPTAPGEPQASGLSNALGIGLPAIGAGAGLIGILQNLAGGRPVTTQQVKSNVQQSPQQAQLTGQTLSTLQGLQGLAQNAELQQAVSRLASGQLPISPDLVKQVTSAFGATAGGLAQNSIENARQRGFSGGMDLLGGAGSPQYSQSLAQLQSDVSQALVNLALGLPQTASNIQSQQVQNANVPLQGQLGLLGQLNQFAGLQGGQTAKTFGPQPNLLSALQPIGQLSQGLGMLGAGRQAFTPQQPQQTLSGVPSQLG